MTLTEILGRIDDLRKSAYGLADDCYKKIADARTPQEESAAKYLHYELTTIACRLLDLTETETEEDFTPSEDEDEDLADEIEDWWYDLDDASRSDISNIPRPTSFDGRGESDCEFRDRTDLWWGSRTYDQKQDIYNEWADEL